MLTKIVEMLEQGKKNGEKDIKSFIIETFTETLYLFLI
jgi:hypothetical protein